MTLSKVRNHSSSYNRRINKQPIDRFLLLVHRILVEDRGILHRDISWGNVLINHEHLEGSPDKMDGHGFIDNILGIR